MNSKIYRQADSRWGSLPYPTKAYSFAGNGCGCCACTHNIIEIPQYANYTPANVRPYMVGQGFATKGHGTTWNGITKTLEHYGFKVSTPNINSSMSGAWDILGKTAPKQGVLLFRAGVKGGIRWTAGGHYVAFLNYKVQNGKHYFYTKDSGGRKHDGWYCYETQMRGLLPKIWIVTAMPTGVSVPAKTTTTTTTTATKAKGTYIGSLPTSTIKKGSKGNAVKLWQKFLNWYGNYGLKVDGIFGKLTVNATKKFQKAQGLTQDGIAGPKTLAKAKAYVKQASPSTTPVTTPTTSTLPKKCIDVSYWQGKISQANWTKIKKSCGYAICRASYTSQSKFSLNVDSTFATNFVNAKAAGLKVGAYHYSQAITVAEAKAEAEYLCKILKNYTPTFYVVCDFEYGGRLNSKIGKKASDIANAFCDVVKAHGYSPCIYANTSTLNNALTNPKYPVWVAQYNSTCTYKGSKVMWQYTSSGRVDGISASNTNNKSANVDLSHVYSEPQIKPIPETTNPPSVTPTVTTNESTSAQTSVPVQTLAKTKYSGVLPNLHVIKSATQVINDALKWGKWIAGNNTFHYGEYGNKAYINPKSKYYAKGKYKPIYNVTHSCGCHFCHTNAAKKNQKASKLGYHGDNWEYTYVCNTFVTAMYAHGGLETFALNKCSKGKCIGMNEKGRSPELDKSKDWKYMGKLPIKSLKAGDILVSSPHMQCVYAPVSNKKVKIIEATSYIGKYKSNASNNSIRIKEKTPSYTSVYRYVGNINTNISIMHGEYSDRVTLWQKFLNWAGFNCGEADGKFGDKTYAATKNFQKQYGLTADGIVGPKSLAKAAEIEK